MPVSLQHIAHDLVALTKLCEETGYELSGGVLGGEHGYGPYLVENDLFVFKSYCWCDADDCAWCGQCTCPPEAFEHRLDGSVISSHEADSMWESVATGEDFRALDARFEERRLSAECPHCTGTGVFATYGAEPGHNAPNFWYRPLDIKVSWYKYLGRSMEASGPLDRWPEAIERCKSRIHVIEGNAHG